MVDLRYEFIVQNYSYKQTPSGEPINWRLTFRIGNLVHHEMGQCVGSLMPSNASFKFNYTGLDGTYWGNKVKKFFPRPHRESNRFFFPTVKSPPPQGQGRFIKIADPSVCPTGTFFFFLVPFKIRCFFPCNSKQHYMYFTGAFVVNSRYYFLSFFQIIEYACVFIISGGVAAQGGCVLCIIFCPYFSEGRLFTVLMH